MISNLCVIDEKNYSARRYNIIIKYKIFVNNLLVEVMHRNKGGDVKWNKKKQDGMARNK